MSNELRVENIDNRSLELDKGNLRQYKTNVVNKTQKKSNEDEIYFYQVLEKQMEFDKKLEEEKQKRR